VGGTGRVTVGSFKAYYWRNRGRNRKGI
jgi:hypothetical protein